VSPDAILDLATSMNPVAPDVRLVVAAAADSIRHYPDATVATTALAEALGVDRTHVLLTNGGAEAIALLAVELGRGRVDEPDFSLYRRHLTEVADDAPRWRSNPHNPSGRLAAAAEQAHVWDEAFYPLATGTWTRGDVSDGAVVVGSLTKVFACPGLRLGYVLSEDPDLIRRLADRQPRWSVGSVALAALPRLLELADLGHWAAQIAALRADLGAVLAAAGLAASPSDANFVLVEAASGLRDRLAREGVVVRDCSSFGMPDGVRIAVPASRGLERLATALGLGSPGRAPGTACTTAAAPKLTGGLLVCGTASDVGKSQIVTGLCRLLARRGVRVAPFKAQNMSLNSFATPSGHEIGRAQGIQAIAAGVEPEVSMNPVLLKPTGERRSQVVVLGRPTAELDAASYQAIKRVVLLPVVLDALADLRSRFDVVICEGAGSPAEINLLEGDIANLSLADAAGLPAVLVGDIERGGVFASLFGTLALLPDELRRWVGGSIINKFRGDVSLLGPGLDELERRTGVPCLGVLPFVRGLSLDAEDSLGLAATIRADGHAAGGSESRSDPGSEPAGSCRGDDIDVAAIALPRLANFTDLDALAMEPAVTVRMVATIGELGDPDLVIVPGSKTTVADLDWLRASGLGAAVRALAATAHGPTVLGICAGFQMLGQSIVDGIESAADRVQGLGLLAVETQFEPDKLTRPRRGQALGEDVSGYEIHHGRPVSTDDDLEPFAHLDDGFGTGPEGASAQGGRIAGTNLHGLFESDGFRRAYLAAVAARRGKIWRPGATSFSEAREAQIDRLADLIEEHLDVDAILGLIATALPGASR